MRSPRVLLFSHRNIYEREVWRSCFFEFERALEQLDAVETYAPRAKRWYPEGKRIASHIGRHSRIAINPGVPKFKWSRDYDLFFAICEKPSELLHLRAVGDWSKQCRMSVCWVTEFFIRDIPDYTGCLEVLKQFDHVFFMLSRHEPFKEIVGAGSYLPPGIDAVLFSPHPNPPERVIDVLSIGRRAPRTHKALLNMARDRRLHYVYDTFASLQCYSIEEHRLLTANMAKRSKFMLVNPGKIDMPGETGGQSEFGYRYFEGAASGAVMIGERPRNNPHFQKIFHWPDAVLPLAFDSDEVASVLTELEGQPERIAAARKNNIIESLLHHDWAYRWEAVLKIAGLDPLQPLVQRKQMLRVLAEQISEGAKHGG